MTERTDSSAPEQPVIDAAQADAWLALALTQRTPEGSHPSDDTLSAWHERRLDTSAATQVELHVSQCDSCFAVWSGLLALEPAAQQAAQNEGLLARLSNALGGLFGTRAGMRRLGGVAAAMFAAVALSVLVFDASQPLPGYSVSLEGNTKYFRNGEETADSAVVFETGNAFQLTLTPATAYEDSLETALYVETANGTLSPLPVPPAQMADTGAVRIAGAVGSAVALPSGSAQLVVVIGQRGRLPAGSQLVDELGARDTVATGQWQAWRIPIEVVAE